MCRKAGTERPAVHLPDRYEFAQFTPGDEHAWAEIEASVAEFDSPEEALKYFRKEYLITPKEVERRTIFIQTDDGEKVGTYTIWWNYTGPLRVPSVHWVAVKPAHQGLGLGKALVCKGIELSIAIEGDRDIYLHTQTWSYIAIALYLQAGFKFMETDCFGGYKNSYALALPILKEKLNISWE